MVLRVGGVGELVGEEPAVFLGQFFGNAHHADAALGGGCEDDFAAEAADEFAPLDGESFGHDRNEGIAFGGAHHGERDAGVAGGGFDDGLAGLQQAAFFGVVDDGVGEAVFHRAAGVA